MTLSRRIGFELLIGMAALLLISQAVEFVQAQKAHRALTKSSLDLLQQRELQQVENFYAAVEHNLSAATARGDMDEFDRVSALQKEAPGFEEFSLYDGTGRIFSSSVRNTKGRLLAADLKARLYAQPERLQQTSTNGIEIYKSVVATPKCLECHDNQKVGSVVGVTYFRFSNDAVTQLAGQFAASQAAANRHWQILAGSVLIAGMLLACGLAVIVSRPIIKIVAPLVNQLGGQSHDIFLAASQVSTSSQILADGASNQAASLEEASASLEEVAAMTRRNDENAKVVREFTTQTRKVSEAGANSTREVRRSMEGIREAGDQLRDAMNGINTASRDVSKVIKSIDEIAFQTNLLALNAAVEAARAGEAGLGFAVVADEVRSLAQRCAVAAKETTEMISASIQRSQEGVRITDKVTVSVEAVASRSRQLEQQLEEILSCAKRVEEQMAQIAVASTEQTAGVSEVSTAICHLDKVTQNNAASAEESSAAALELTRQASLLKEALGGLQELIGGSQAQNDLLRTDVKSRADSAPRSVRRQSASKARSTGAQRTAKTAELAEVAD